MGVETKYMASKLAGAQKIVIGQWPYWSGRYEGVPLVICRTSWGMANAAAATALAMERFRPCAVISQGTAGAHDPKLRNYDLVIASQTVNEAAWKSRYAPAGAGADYRDIEKLGVFAYDKAAGGFTQAVYHAADTGLLAAAVAVRGSYRHGRVVTGIIGTCDSWNLQADRILFLHEFYGSLAEEMECDAVAQVCQTYDVPFLGLRVISNTVFEGDVDWDLAVGAACQEFALDTAREYCRGLAEM